MTVKKRLAIPNIIMIVAPVIITLLIGSICHGAVYLTLNNSNGFGFESSGEFYNTSQAVSGKMYEVFEHGSEDTKSRLEIITGALYTIVTGPATVSKMNDTLNRTNFNFLFFIIGIALIFLLETAKYFVQKKSA